ncbi:hypothetical protein M422DRAFT_239617 [Sphaerobolus stellatus SS14]|nr:hypothetical protein M422DRAFT_239617 [Sphaerobolus stellatus SS14]
MAKFSAIILITLIRLAVALPAPTNLLLGSARERSRSSLLTMGVAEMPNPPATLARGKDGFNLVNDAAHPFIVAGPNDIRGPCPALNTLASHGMIRARLMLMLTSVINPHSTRLSSKGLSPLPRNMVATALMTSMPPPSSATNVYKTPSRRTPNSSSPPLLNLDAARGFFQNQRMPVDFHRQPAPCPFTPGVNHGKNNYVLQPQIPALSDFCGIYRDIALRVVPAQYLNPTGDLKKALKKNLDFFFGSVKTQHNCTQVYPYGK